MSDLTDRIQDYLREQDAKIPDSAESMESVGMELLALAGELYAASKLFVRLGERILAVSQEYPRGK